MFHYRKRFAVLPSSSHVNYPILTVYSHETILSKSGRYHCTFYGATELVELLELAELVELHEMKEVPDTLDRTQLPDWVDTMELAASVIEL